jgi:ribonuclease HI
MSHTLSIPGVPPTTTPTLPKVATTGMVIYTDGGAKPNPGDCGWGMHGYVYSLDEPKKGNGFKKGVMTTRGYFPKLADGEKPITILKYIDGFKAVPDKGTNNTAELEGAIAALEWVRDYGVVLGVGKVVIRPDAKYVVEGITEWVIGWVRNNWVNSSGGPVANIDTWKTLLALTEHLQSLNVDIEWLRVDGHSGEPGNDIVDYYATIGRVGAKNGFGGKSEIIVTDAQGYWTQSYEPNRLLSFNLLYFNTNIGGACTTNDGRNIYYLGKNSVEPEQEGKPQGDTRYSVVFLKERDPIIDVVLEAQDRFCIGKGQHIAQARLDNIFATKHVANIQRFGGVQFETKPGRLSMFMPYNPGNDDTGPIVEITRVMTTPRTISNAVNALVTLQYILEDASKGDSRYTVTDITSLLYEVDESKKKPVCQLKKSIDSTVKSFKVDLAYCTSQSSGQYPVDLSLDIDMPDRNTLSALAEKIPTVRVITWEESSIAFRYATIVSYGDNIGIWAAVHSNLRVLPLKQG